MKREKTNNTDRPDHYIYYDKKRSLYIACRNNLSKSIFQNNNDGYYYFELFEDRSFKCFLEINIPSRNFSSVFNDNQDGLSIRGGPQGFGIKAIYDKNLEPTFHSSHVKISLVRNDKVYGKAHKRKSNNKMDVVMKKPKKERPKTGYIGKGETKVVGYSSVDSYYAAHPFSGGSFNGK